jgi:serine protein kinase
MSVDIFQKMKKRYDARVEEEMTIQEFFERCSNPQDGKKYYADAAERMLTAIGDPVIVDTREDDRMSRIFLNRRVKTYPEAFGDFWGMEDTIESIVSFFVHAAQGLEEKKQILYLLGPVGGGKSSIAERLKELMQRVPVYTLKAYNKERDEWETSPCFEHPFGLIDYEEDSVAFSEKYNIPRRYFACIRSPWATKRFLEGDNDITRFKVVNVYPSFLEQKLVTKVEPGDDNNQDISTLVGKVNIRELEDHVQHDPDAYDWAGGLNITGQGLLEIVEMFKAPIKMLHPLLTATQEGHYNGTEQFGAIPFQGIIVAHSNESEWDSFRNNSNNEAFLDRVNIIKVPYCLRVAEEVKIYEKLIKNSDLANAPCAPGTLEMMGQYSALTRLHKPENSNLYSKLEIYDGKNLKSKDPKAKSIDEYRDEGGVNEGMKGSSTRFAFKILSKVYNFDPDEVAANPIYLMHVLTKQIAQEQLSPELEENRLNFVRGILVPRYAEFLGDELQKAYLESYKEYGQNMFDRYIQLADFWVQDKDYRDSDTGEVWDKDGLHEELQKIEKPFGVNNFKDFRFECVDFVMRHRANNRGESPDWTKYEKLREVIEKRMFANTEVLLPIISFGKKKTKDEEEKHNEFVKRMMDRGYTEKQVRLAVEWHMRYSKSN